MWPYTYQSLLSRGVHTTDIHDHLRCFLTRVFAGRPNVENLHMQTQISSKVPTITELNVKTVWCGATTVTDEGATQIQPFKPLADVQNTFHRTPPSHMPSASHDNCEDASTPFIITELSQTTCHRPLGIQLSTKLRPNFGRRWTANQKLQRINESVRVRGTVRC